MAGGFLHYYVKNVKKTHLDEKASNAAVRYVSAIFSVSEVFAVAKVKLSLPTLPKAKLHYRG